MFHQSPQSLTAIVLSLLIGGVMAHGQESTANQPADLGVRPVQQQAVDPVAWLSLSRQQLMNARSMTATIQQQGQMVSGRFASQGTYAAGQFPRLRIEMTMELGGLTGHRLEVCDGQVLWTERQISGLPVDPSDEDSTGIETDVVRRDIDLIRDALANSPQTFEHVLAAEIGVGGLPSLLAGLQSAFEFRAKATEDQSVILVGRWNADARDRLNLSGASPRVPTEVEIRIDPSSPVPEQISYIRSNGETRQELLSIRFSDVRIGGPIDDRLFAYSPPDGIDVTNQTLKVVERVEAVGKSTGE